MPNQENHSQHEQEDGLDRVMEESSVGDFDSDDSKFVFWPVSKSERRQVHLDVYGHLSPIDAFVEDRIASVERELARVPHNEKQSLLKAQTTNPLLFITSSQLKLVVLDPEFDPTVAARKIVKYWEKRELFFGESAFSDDVFTNATLEDYIHYYYKSLDAISDPDSDEFTKILATEYLRCVNTSKIEAFDAAIEKIPPQQKSAFLSAQRIPETLASDEQKIGFLLAENLVEASAAQRMVNFWEFRFRLLGEERALKSRVSLDSLDEHMSSISLGVVRLLPSSDAAGRGVILVSVPKLIEGEGTYTEEGIQIALWYVLQTAMERECCRKNGVILIVDTRLERSELFRCVSVRKKCVEVLFNSFPIKVKAVHYCGVPLHAWVQYLLGLLLSQLGRKVVGRILLHSGNNEEVIGKLGEYGISKKQIPVELGGDVDFGQWKSWLEERRLREL